MKRSLAALPAAAAPLALSMALAAGCGAGPLDDADPAVAAAGPATTEVSAAATIVKPPVGDRPPLPTSFTATIDFDSSPGGPVASGTMVDNTYASTGVTFSCVSCSSGHAFALFFGLSGNNAVSLFAPPAFGPFDARFGAVQATFASPRSTVSIDATPMLSAEFGGGAPVARPFIEAFDAAGNLIVPVVRYPFFPGTAGFGTTQTLTVTSPTANVHHVLFSTQHPGPTPPVYGSFDNLRYNVSRIELLLGTI